MAMERQRRRSNQSVTIRDVAAHVGVSPMTVAGVAADSAHLEQGYFSYRSGLEAAERLLEPVHG